MVIKKNEIFFFIFPLIFCEPLAPHSGVTLKTTGLHNQIPSNITVKMCILSELENISESITLRSVNLSPSDIKQSSWITQCIVAQQGFDSFQMIWLPTSYDFTLLLI